MRNGDRRSEEKRGIDIPKCIVRRMQWREGNKN